MSIIALIAIPIDYTDKYPSGLPPRLNYKEMGNI